MDARFGSFVHPAHHAAFVDAARRFECHILVRQTGTASIGWIGREGYTGKRGDMKAKTAKKDVGPWQVAGLVCSPELQPGAFHHLKDAQKYWDQCRDLITVPPDGRGFDDRANVRVPTPYVLQNNRQHKHYGCIAWVEMGLVSPRYVHGDYDLYALVPVGEAFDPQAAATAARAQQAGSLMQPRFAGQKLTVTDYVGPLSFRIASFVNNRIAEVSGAYADALMVNHGEQINIGPAGLTNERVLAFMSLPPGQPWGRVLEGAAEHVAFFRDA